MNYEIGQTYAHRESITLTCIEQREVDGVVFWGFIGWPDDKDLQDSGFTFDVCSDTEIYLPLLKDTWNTGCSHAFFRTSYIGISSGGYNVCLGCDTRLD